MNASSYKTVFSKRLGALVAVGEHATSQGKANGASGPGASGANDGAVSALAGIGYVAALSASFAFVSLAWAAPASNALPTGGTVVQGAASMAQSTNQLNITQSTQRAAINWQSFNIGAAATVNVAQPNAQAVLLNRVVGQSPSQIFGKLQANGHVILVNPNGVLFGKDGSVNAGGFTASTLNISDANFMAGNMVYERNGSTAGIQNLGNITAEQPGGYVALLGATVSNEGSITTKGGSVVMGAGETIKVPVSGTGRIKLELTPAAINASVSNSGSIVTEGGQVYMQALALNRAAAQILQSGSIDTTGEKGGEVHVLADGGHIRVDGSIKANSTNGTAGGDIYIGRDKDTNVLAAVGDASGARLESKGGFVETSGKFLNVDGTRVMAKEWLLDPDNIDITGDATAATAGYSKIKASDIVANLNIGTSVTIATSPTAGTSVNQPGYKDTLGTGAGTRVEGDGNILVNAVISKTLGGEASLTLLADNGITVNQEIKSTSNKLNVTMKANGSASGASSQGLLIKKSIDANGGAINLEGKTTNSAAAVTVEQAAVIQGSSVTMVGNSTSGAAIKGTGKVNATAGGVSITGVGNTTGDYAITTNNTIDATGDILISTTSAALHGIAIREKVTSSGGKVELYADVRTSGNGSAMNGNFAIKAKNDVTITGKSNGYYSVNGLGAIESTDGKVTIEATSSASSALRLTNTVKAKGNVLIKGTAHNDSGINTGSTTTVTSTDGDIEFIGTTTGSGVGVNFTGTTNINATKGTFKVTAESKNSQGIVFQGNTNINTATYTIDAKSLGGAAGLYHGSGTTTLTSTAGNSSIKGTSETGGGVFAFNGTINLNANNGSNTTFSSGKGEMRLGWNKGVTLNTNGDVTLGSHATGLTFQADAFATGKLTLKGQAAGGGDGIYFTEGAGDGAKIIGTDATVLIHGISTGSGRGVILQPAGVANSISSTGTGSIEIIGESATGSGVRVGGTTISSGGLTKITGVSKGGTGDGVTSTGVVNAGSIDIRGTAVGGRGVVVGATHTATSGDVYIDGKSTNNIASEVSGAVNANGTNASITLLGTSQNSVGIQLASTLTAKNLVTVTGESKANTTGTFFTGTSGVDAASYQVKGTSKTATGINIDGGTVTFKSSSNTVDSLIEGKGAARGIQKVSGTLNLLNSGNKKATMQSATDSGGGLVIGSANGLTVNTVGDVTIGSLNDSALLTIQRTKFNANGGNLSLKGKSSGNGITMQDGGGDPVQIIGTNGAKISLEGESSGVGTGVDFGLINSAIVHNISTNGTVTLIGKSANGFGVNTHSSTVTGSTVNVVADTLNIGSTSTINAGTSANPGTGLVTLKTATSNREIRIGADDVTTSGSQKLGLSQVELDRIRAANLVIGDASTGNITVSGAATTAASTGKITLQTGGSIAVNAALTVSNAAGIKHLTLDAGGAITNGASGKLTAQDLTLKAGSTIGSDVAAIKTNVDKVSLTSAGNQFLVEDNNVSVTAKTTGNGNINITTTNGTMKVEPVNGVSGIDAGTGNVRLTATSGSGEGILMRSDVKGKDITVDATANNGTGLGFYGAGGSFNASGSLNLTGTATGTGNGFYSFGGTHTAQTGINITGTSANGQGVGFDANAKLTNAVGDIVIKGTANGTNTQGIGLRGSEIINNGANIKLTAVSGDIFTEDKNSQTLNPLSPNNIYWGLTGPLKNIISNNGTGVVEITAGSIKTDTGAIDGKVLTINQKGNGGVLVKTTGNGNVIAPKITNAGTGNVVIAAGSLKDAGDGSGGQVLTSSGSPVTQTSSGKTFIYSGNAAGTGVLSNLDNTLGALKIDGTAAQNADTNAAFGAGAGISGSTAKAQAIFREKISFANGTLSDATLTKVYGDDNTKNTAAAALLAEAKGALKNDAANSGTNSTVTTGTVGSNNRIEVSKSAVADTLTSTLTGGQFSTSQFLKAQTGTYKFNGMTSTKYDVGTGIDVTVNVEKRALTGSITPGNTTYGDSLVTGTASFTNKVGSDVVNPFGVNIATAGNTSGSGNLNAGTYAGIQSVSGLTGADAANYSFTNVKGDYKVDKRPLTIAPGSIGTKTADGTAAATVTPGTLSNLVGTETLGVAATGTFSDANPGNNKAVNAFYTLQNGANGGVVSNYVLNLGTPANPDTRMTGNILASVNPVTPIAPVNNNTGSLSRVRTVSGFGGAGAATGVLDDKAVTESREVCSDVFPENCECQASVIPSIEICFAPKSVAATKEEK